MYYANIRNKQQIEIDISLVKKKSVTYKNHFFENQK